MTPDPADPRNVAHRHVVGELSVLCPQASDLVGLMMRGREPHGNCTVSLSYVLIMSSATLYKSDPLYGLDLSLLLKGLTLQRYPVPRAHPGPPIAGLHPRMDSDMMAQQGSNSVDELIQEFELQGPPSGLGDVRLVDHSNKHSTLDYGRAFTDYTPCPQPGWGGSRRHPSWTTSGGISRPPKPKPHQLNQLYHHSTPATPPP